MTELSARSDAAFVIGLKGAQWEATVGQRRYLVNKIRNWCPDMSEAEAFEVVCTTSPAVLYEMLLSIPV